MRSAGVELGGTKCIVVLAEDEEIVATHTVQTTDAEATLRAVRDRLAEWQADAPVSSLGIASFGPIRVDPAAPDYGTMLATTKSGWPGAPVLQTIASAVDCPVALDTDVNGAALAEHAMGAARGCGNAVYLTIGTGIGGGVLLNGEPVHGVMHPEIGHVRVRRMRGDEFGGICSFHGDCAEGLVSGPALEARFGTHPSNVPPGDERWQAPAAELAELLCTLVLTLSPHRIVVGGGVALKQPQMVRDAAWPHCSPITWATSMKTWSSGWWCSLNWGTWRGRGEPY